MSATHKPARLSLVQGTIKRGDTIEAWSFTATGVPSPADAVATFSLHLDTLNSTPLIELESPTDFTLSVAAGVISGEVPRINAPAVGTLLWELQIRVPTVSVAGPASGKWNRTLAEGTINCVQDGAERALP